MLPSSPRRRRIAPAGVLLALLAVLAATSGPAAADAAPRAPASAVTGSRGALVITVALKESKSTGLPKTDPGLTPAQVSADVIDKSRPWFEQASHGLFAGYFALKRGPVSVQTTQKVCSDAWVTELADQADASIRLHEPNLDPRAFGAAVYYFGNVQTCSFSGKSLGRRVFLNGVHNLGTSVHELGHNLGLGHSGRLACTDANGIAVPFSATCTADEYGDIYSSMGRVLSDRYSPTQTASLGWDANHVTVIGAGDVVGAPLHLFLNTVEANVAGARQTLDLFDGDSQFWVEFRRPTQFTFPGVNGGLLVRQQPTTGGRLMLLAMNPPDGGLPHPQMNVGQTWTNPLGTLRIRLDSFDESGANVTISSTLMPPPPPPPPPPPTPTPTPTPTSTPTPTLVTVPNVVGDEKFAAMDAITGRGLAVGTVGSRVDPLCEDLNTIFAQTPAGGTQVSPGSRVDLVVAVPPRNGCPIPP